MGNRNDYDYMVVNSPADQINIDRLGATIDDNKWYRQARNLLALRTGDGGRPLASKRELEIEVALHRLNGEWSPAQCAVVLGALQASAAPQASPAARTWQRLPTPNTWPL